MAQSEKKRIKTVVGFCSSRFGKNPIYAEHARELGLKLFNSGIEEFVYGGGTSGLMGVFAQAAMDGGCKVTGVITHAFKKSPFYAPLEGAEEIVVRTLPSRKAKMIAKADAGIILFGGIGTLDEQFELAAGNDMMIAARSRTHLKPIVVLNSNGVFDHMKHQMRVLIEEEAIHPGRERMIRSVDTPDEVIAKLVKWSDEGIMKGQDLAPSVREPIKHGIKIFSKIS